MVGTVTRRWRPSAGQKACLESTFAAHNMPGTPEINQLAVALGLAPRQVRIWFQNKRQRAHIEPKTAKGRQKRALAAAYPSAPYMGSPFASVPYPSSSYLASSHPSSPRVETLAECASPGVSSRSQQRAFAPSPLLRGPCGCGEHSLPLLPTHMCVTDALLFAPERAKYQLSEQNDEADKDGCFAMLEEIEQTSEWDLSNIAIGELLEALDCC